ncbi:cytochrome P450 [Mycolicibacterium aichiense]|uniref:Steroid C26-monooxygenase n=1 Tax=Mycolicibacterium aichiense TaxID=1799 RepID=A0AAD1MG18_9MYCO|nr:cytochrome P450 [Mycolicibacterium aichiense]STZ25569.1 cytochrome P450 124 cyp124 [Mycolicibacterium aichiense]
MLVSADQRGYSAHDITSRRFWGQTFDVREQTFAALRATDGLTWHEPFPSLFPMDEPGFWALTRRADIVHASLHPELFSSAQGIALDPMPADIQRIATFFLMMDPPQHTVYRRLISSAFTPRNVAQIDEQIRKNAATVVDELVGAGEVDFVAACSARLPMMTISEMLGVPNSDREAVAKAAEKLFSMSDDEYATIEERAEATVNEMFLLAGTGIELAKFRRRHPGDDLMTSIVNAEVDGHRLTDEEIGAFLVLLASAGNDTTKQTTSHAMLALAANPDQRAWLMADFDGRIGPAVEEFIRWATPVLQFARFVAHDTELAGQQLNAGDKVGLFYCSANRDDAAFDRPGAFDLQRSPNPHLGFGGGGPHFCLGNQLARTELRNLFRELLFRVDIELGEPDYLLSSFVHGIKRLPAFVR